MLTRVLEWLRFSRSGWYKCNFMFVEEGGLEKIFPCHEGMDIQNVILKKNEFYFSVSLATDRYGWGERHIKAYLVKLYYLWLTVTLICQKYVEDYIIYISKAMSSKWSPNYCIYHLSAKLLARLYFLTKWTSFESWVVMENFLHLKSPPLCI